MVMPRPGRALIAAKAAPTNHANFNGPNQYAHIARHPGTGSLRYAHELDLAGLRFWPLRRYPYLVFYFPQPDHIDVWRVLHGARDLPAWLAGDGQAVNPK